MAKMIDSLQNLYQGSKDQILEDFFTFLKFQSVSSESNHKKDVLDCANWLRKFIDDMGFEVEEAGSGLSCYNPL